MTELYILDRNLNLLGVIDEYVSIIWRPAYYDIGDFEIYMGATEKAVKLLSKNNYVVRSSDITVDGSGNTTYKNVMIIKNAITNTDVENGDFLTVTGRELKFILNQRIVWKQTNLTGTAENGIRRLVNENAIAPTDSKRVIPGLVLGTAAALTDTIEKQITGDKLDEAIVTICAAYNYGWDVYIYNNQLVFTVYSGLDRSYGQTARPYVVFSESFDNLYNTEYQLSAENYANTTLIGGEGEGKDRVYATVGAENTGLDRYEVFTDAKSVSSKTDNGELSASQYKKLLEEQGRENLAEFGYTEGFSGEVLSDVAFKYRKDFFIGDLVTVINKYGIERNTRVLSAIESEDETGKKLIPQFNL